MSSGRWTSLGTTAPTFRIPLGKIGPLPRLVQAHAVGKYVVIEAMPVSRFVGNPLNGDGSAPTGARSGVRECVNDLAEGDRR